MTCKRCGEHTPRLTLSQIHCPRCEQEVQTIIALDARRRAPRFSVGKSYDRYAR